MAPDHLAPRETTEGLALPVEGRTVISCDISMTDFEIQAGSDEGDYFCAHLFFPVELSGQDVGTRHLDPTTSPPADFADAIGVLDDDFDRAVASDAGLAVTFRSGKELLAKLWEAHWTEETEDSPVEWFLDSWGGRVDVRRE
jgi:hypothetical protein